MGVLRGPVTEIKNFKPWLVEFEGERAIGVKTPRGFIVFRDSGAVESVAENFKYITLIRPVTITGIEYA